MNNREDLFEENAALRSRLIQLEVEAQERLATQVEMEKQTQLLKGTLDHLLALLKTHSQKQQGNNQHIQELSKKVLLLEQQKSAAQEANARLGQALRMANQQIKALYADLAYKNHLIKDKLS